MSGLSEVSMLLGQRAGDLEKARDIFAAEMKSFVENVLGGIRRARSEPWVNGRVRVDLPREIEAESRVGYLSSHSALARCELRFRREARFVQIAEVRFGIEFDDVADAFVWQVELVPADRYPRVDDYVWRAWQGAEEVKEVPGSSRQERANTVRFVARGLDASLTSQVAFDDIKKILEFLLATGGPLAEAIGLDLEPAGTQGSVVS